MKVPVNLYQYSMHKIIMLEHTGQQYRWHTHIWCGINPAAKLLTIWFFSSHTWFCSAWDNGEQNLPPLQKLHRQRYRRNLFCAEGELLFKDLGRRSVVSRAPCSHFSNNPIWPTGSLGHFNGTRHLRRDIHVALCSLLVQARHLARTHLVPQNHLQVILWRRIQQ